MLLIASTISTALSFQNRLFVAIEKRFCASHPPIPRHPRDIHAFSPLSLFLSYIEERERDHISSDEFIHESNFFSLCSLEILGERGKKLKSLLITTLEKLCKLKRMKKKKKNCIFFITFGGRYSKRWRRPSDRDREKRSCWIEDSYYTPSGQYNETIVVRRAA